MDQKDRVGIWFGEAEIGALDENDARLARAHVARSRPVFARVAAVTQTNPKRLIVAITASL
jgi:hypothetical protein